MITIKKNRNGQRANGIFYSSIGLVWKKFGKKYLKDLKIKNINKVYEYKEIVIEDIEQARKISNIKDLLYVDTYGKLCCTKTLESAINLVKYNEI